MLITTEAEEFDADIGVEANFVGRADDIQKLNENFNRHRIFGIFGLRSVGKSRLVREYIKKHVKQERQVIIVDCREIADIAALYTSLCVNLQVEPNPNDVAVGEWVKTIVNVVHGNENNSFLFLFDNTEDYQDNNVRMRDSFLTLCTTLVRRCFNVKIFITSTTRVQFSQLHKVYFSHEVLPLKGNDALELLLSELEGSGVKLGEYSRAIIQLSEGLPLLILMIASELKEDGGMLTPKDMVELLSSCRLKSLSREFYPEEDRVADVYRKFIERLSRVYQRRLAVLEYIPGSFTAEQARQMLAFPTEALVKDQALIPIRRRHYLLYDTELRRFNIQGILRECLQTFAAINNIPEVRERYVRTFTQVMSAISEQLGTDKHIQMMADLAVEQPNLTKLLKQVDSVREDTYKFFIKMATDCTLVIEKYMAGDAHMFYDGCLRAAEMYGQQSDKAVVNIAVGSLYTNTKGDLVTGEDRYNNALKILQKNGHKSVQLAAVHQRLGWNLMLQGKCQDAINHLDASLAISSTSGPENQLLVLSTMSSKGVTYTLLGNFEEAERCHFATLRQRVKLQGADHPAVGATLNNIGLMYDQRGDTELALDFFLKGLEIKKKSKAPDLSIMASMNNVARHYAELGMTDKARAMLDEVEEVLGRQPVIPGDPVAYMYDTRGTVFKKEGRLEDARAMLEKSVEKRGAISEDNPPYCESMVHLAEVCGLQKDYDSCLKTADKVMKIQKRVIETMPQNMFIKDCLEFLAAIYKDMGDMKRYRETLAQLESELMRLERVIGETNQLKMQQISSSLEDVQFKLDKLNL